MGGYRGCNAQIIRVLASWKKQLPRLREARENGKIAYFSYDRLVVSDRLDDRT